ncbi:MAG: nucleotidyl transferase AbiEii/AbiGii toxin family protein [Clostridiales bacterium]|nr:nucleotidyl transferase AbiEii/AbiGii toxin family protein [Clostridiales bacterium]
MSGKAMSLKAKISNYAKSNNLPSQVVLQNYMFERFLERLSKSDFREKFVIKGGVLVASIVGLSTRSTMDLDTTLRKLPLTVDKITDSVNSICTVNIDDEVSFSLISIQPIRKDDIYGGYQVRLDAKYDPIITPLSIDISTGDIITPDAIEYDFTGMFEPELKIPLWGYNVETILAEKVETILRRSVLTTRSRDFYDVYILVKTIPLIKAFLKTLLKLPLNTEAVRN